jgi:outer membrane protein assembly factor BamD (BamD/ComL family)
MTEWRNFHAHKQVFMRRSIWIALIVVLLISAACGRGPGVLEKEKPGADLFRSAQKEFAEARYSEAFSLYEQYIARYPDAPMVQAALLRMGMIMGRLGEYGQAVAYLEQVLYNFPGTLSARRAAVERLRVLYAGGEPE